MKPELFLISFYIAEVLTALTITIGPQDTTVCINQVTSCTCGFAGADPNFVVPNWRIIKRRNGVVVSDEIISGSEIVNNTNDGLEWIADPHNGNNSVLRVGPVDGTDDQSSYQCSFALLNRIIESIIGILTVVDPPLMTSITVEDTGTTFITISWISTSGGSVNYTISLSSSTGDVIMSHITTDTQYTINGLTSNTSYRISVVPSVGMCQGEGIEEMVNTEDVLPTGTTFPTSAVVMPTNVTDKDTPINEDSNTTIIIIIVILVAAVALAVIVVIIVAVIYWKHKQTQLCKNLTNRVGSVDGSEEDESHKETREGLNHNDSEYAYARTGPREVSFQSN